MKKTFMSLIVFLFCTLVLKAQETTVSIAFDKYTSLLDSLKALKDEIQSFQSEISVLRDNMNFANNKNVERCSIIDSLRYKNRILVDSLEKVRWLYNDDEEVIMTLDMIRVRYVGARLQLEYAREKVGEALRMFDGCRNDEVKNVLEQIDSDLDKTDLGNFSSWKQHSLHNLRNTDYYSNVYKNDYAVKINYLDNIISETEKRINDASDPRYYGDQTVDLTDIRNML